MNRETGQLERLDGRRRRTGQLVMGGATRTMRAGGAHRIEMSGGLPVHSIGWLDHKKGWLWNRNV